MTYTEYISQFQIFDNPPKKKGYHRHHIVPQSEQTEPDNRQIYLTWPQHFWAHILYDREHGTKTALMFLQLCGKPVEFFDCYAKCLAYTYTYKKKTESAGQKISLRISGKNHPLYGKHLTNETKQKKSDSIKKIWQNQDYRNKMSTIQKETWSNVELKERHSEIIKKAWQNQEVKEKQSAAMKKVLNNPEVRAKWSIVKIGTHWWNNGIINKLSRECPGEGFVLGRLRNEQPSLVQE